jgi:hypothetical protein
MSEETRSTCKVSQERLLVLNKVSSLETPSIEDLRSSCPFCDIMVAFHEKEVNVSNFDASI